MEMNKMRKKVMKTEEVEECYCDVCGEKAELAYSIEYYKADDKLIEDSYIDLCEKHHEKLYVMLLNKEINLKDGAKDEK